MEEAQTPPKARIVSYRTKACEACWHRKVKCDRSMPCSSCRTLGIPCQARPPGQSTRKRPREPSPDQAEEKLDDAHTRLARLEQIISSTTMPAHSKGAPITNARLAPSHQSKAHSTNLAESQLESHLEDTFYRGDSSFEAHSGQAGKVLERAVTNASYSKTEGVTPPSLSTLQGLLHANKPCSHKHFDHDLPLPSRDLVLYAIRLSKQMRHRLALAFALLEVEVFTEHCQKIYFPVDGYSIADFVSMHAALLSIIRNITDADLQHLKMQPSDILDTIELCQKNITAALEQLNLFLYPCIDNIIALIMGAAAALEDSRMSIAWRLTSIAARLCLDAGFHRLREDTQDSRLNNQKRCFWHVYCLEKILALNFGRTSILQDFDITTRYANPYPWLPDSPWHTLMHAFCDSSKVDSKIYEKLYSVHGQQQSPETKSKSVESIAQEHMHLIKFCKTDFRDVVCPNEFHTCVAVFLISLYSTLTLTHAAVRPSNSANPLEFSSICIETARTCLQLHCELSERYMAQANDDWRQYIHWGLLLSPFMPFLAMLGSIVSNPAYEPDIQLLKRMLKTLEAAAQHAPGAKKIHKICQILFQTTAKNLGQADSGTLTADTEQAGHLLADNHSSTHPLESVGEGTQRIAGEAALGEPTSTFNPHGQFDFNMSDTNFQDMSHLFEDFLGGNTSMLDMLDVDPTQPDWTWDTI